MVDKIDPKKRDPVDGSIIEPYRDMHEVFADRFNVLIDARENILKKYHPDHWRVDKANKEIADLKDLQKRLTGKTPEDIEVIDVSKYEEQIKDLEKKVQRADIEQKDLDRNIKKFMRERDQALLKAGDANKLADQIKEAERQYSALEKDLLDQRANYEGLVKDLEKELKESRDQVEKLEQAILKMEQAE